MVVEMSASVRANAHDVEGGLRDRSNVLTLDGGEAKDGLVLGHGETKDGLVLGHGETKDGLVLGDGELDNVVLSDGEVKDGLVLGHGETKDGLVLGDGELDNLVLSDGEVKDEHVLGDREAKDGLVPGNEEAKGEFVVDDGGENDELVFADKGARDGLLLGDGEAKGGSVLDGEEAKGDYVLGDEEAMDGILLDDDKVKVEPVLGDEERKEEFVLDVGEAQDGSVSCGEKAEGGLLLGDGKAAGGPVLGDEEAKDEYVLGVGEAKGGSVDAEPTGDRQETVEQHGVQPTMNLCKDIPTEGDERTGNQEMFSGQVHGDQAVSERVVPSVRMDIQSVRNVQTVGDVPTNNDEVAGAVPAAIRTNTEKSSDTPVNDGGEVGDSLPHIRIRPELAAYCGGEPVGGSVHGGRAGGVDELATSIGERCVTAGNGSDYIRPGTCAGDLKIPGGIRITGGVVTVSKAYIRSLSLQTNVYRGKAFVAMVCDHLSRDGLRATVDTRTDIGLRTLIHRIHALGSYRKGDCLRKYLERLERTYWRFHCVWKDPNAEPTDDPAEQLDKQRAEKACSVHPAECHLTEADRENAEPTDHPAEQLDKQRAEKACSVHPAECHLTEADRENAEPTDHPAEQLDKQRAEKPCSVHPAECHLAEAGEVKLFVGGKEITLQRSDSIVAGRCIGNLRIPGGIRVTEEVVTVSRGYLFQLSLRANACTGKRFLMALVDHLSHSGLRPSLSKQTKDYLRTLIQSLYYRIRLLARPDLHIQRLHTKYCQFPIVWEKVDATPTVDRRDDEQPAEQRTRKRHLSETNSGVGSEGSERGDGETAGGSGELPPTVRRSQRESKPRQMWTSPLWPQPSVKQRRLGLSLQSGPPEELPRPWLGRPQPELPPQELPPQELPPLEQLRLDLSWLELSRQEQLRKKLLRRTRLEEKQLRRQQLRQQKLRQQATSTEATSAEAASAEAASAGATTSAGAGSATST